MFQTLIASTVVGAGGTTSISFNSIPQTYTDLVIVFGGIAGVTMTFNGSSSGYSWRTLEGRPASGIPVRSNTATAQTNIQLGWQSFNSQIVSCQAVIPNYTLTNNKTVSSESISEDNSSDTYLFIQSSLWANTAAITSITLSWFGLTIPQNSIASLYGTLRGSGGATVA